MEVFSREEIPIQRAPAQTRGAPWPLPQFLNSTRIPLYLQADSFQFVVTHTTCDILEQALHRYHTTIFGQLQRKSIFSLLHEFPRLFMRSSSDSLYPVVTKFNISLESACDSYPSLESNESCKYYC